MFNIDKKNKGLVSVGPMKKIHERLDFEILISYN